MAKRLVCAERGRVAWLEVEEKPLQPGQVRVRAQYGVEKHGTMVAFYKGYANDRGKWDSEARIHRTGEGELWGYPIPLGNMQLGEVVEVGAEVERLKVGDVVFHSGDFRPSAEV